MPEQSVNRECPMCGEFMRCREEERPVRVPGHPEVRKVMMREWVCPECEHFEEVVDLD